MSDQGRPDDDAVLRWVRQLNALAADLDETAAAIHPSAWPEALKDQTERWKRLAKQGPAERGGRP